MQLFGFESMDELEMFCQLITVSGIGPKAGLSILGTLSADDIRFAVLADDAATIAKAPGIGAKTAQQIVLDLKGKLVEEVQESKTEENQELNDAMDALRALGYRGGELTALRRELAKLEPVSTDAYIRKALGIMAKKSGV